MNTDYTYDETATVIGTEYDGQSQRSSLTSNLPDTPCNDKAASLVDSEGEISKSRNNSSDDSDPAKQIVGGHVLQY